MARDVQEQKVLDGVPQGLFIGGQWREAAGGSTFAVEDPATGETLMSLANAGAADALAALDSAVSAQAGWAATPPREPVCTMAIPSSPRSGQASGRSRPRPPPQPRASPATTSDVQCRSSITRLHATA